MPWRRSRAAEHRDPLPVCPVLRRRLVSPSALCPASCQGSCCCPVSPQLSAGLGTPQQRVPAWTVGTPSAAFRPG